MTNCLVLLATGLTAVRTPRTKSIRRLLRICENDLLNAGIELPDTAREIVFPKDVPIIETTAPTSVEGSRREVWQRTKSGGPGGHFQRGRIVQSEA